MLSFAKLKRLYQGAPLWAQGMYSSIPFGIRAGRVYRDTVGLLRKSEFLSRDELLSMQNEHLQRLLVHAYDHTHYYRQAFIKSGFDPRRDDIEENYHRLPFLDKTVIRQNSDQLIAEKLDEPTYRDNTGGSSGNPMAFLKNNSMYPRELAFMFDQWSRVGYEPTMRKMTLRGRALPKKHNKKYLFNPIYNELVLSSYHIDASTLGGYWAVLERFAPKFIHGYPSAIVQFLKCALENDLPLPVGIRAVFCGSEPLYDYQRTFIQDVLATRAYSWYGQSECVLLAGECEQNQEYHSHPLYGKLELVNENNELIKESGVEGEIVATSLGNFAMPFIRYRTGDRGVLAGNACTCGRSFRRLGRVSGRVQHLVYTSQMVPVPVTAFVFGQHFQAFEKIRELQLVQNYPGQIVVRIVSASDFSVKDEDEMRRKMQSCVDGELLVEVEYCERLPRNQAGKLDFVIQNIKTELP